MKRQIVLASNNKGKIAEIQSIFGGQFELVGLKDVGFDKDIPEPYNTFFENALTKAKTVFDFCNMPCLGEDSGLCVTALNDAPGVLSARYSGGNDSDNVDLVLKNMQGVQDRRAKFVSCIVLYYGPDRYVTATGETWGQILQERQGNGGFGYDPIFFSDDLNMSLGQATMAQKNTISHRSKALKSIKEQISKLRYFMVR